MITYDLNGFYNIKVSSWEFVCENNMGKRGRFDGSREEQFVGLIGERMVKYFFGMPTEITNTGFDGGVDITLPSGHTFDVKTMTRNVEMRDHYHHNLVASQLSYDVDFYVFCTLNKKQNTFTICGYIPKFVFLIASEYYEKGEQIFRDNGTSFTLQADNAMIEQSKLYPVDNLRGIGIRQHTK